ncbi:anion permease [Bradyrhizobium sp.]|uniref:anion permease n=1 Tax=Bradyrhizobium sp. TaxID=376 RepID=UPI002610FEA2|nr:anion permease [Bradyrhizobium sp.]
MLAVFGFAVVVWVTDALDYAVSAIVIAALMAFLLGISPNIANPNMPIGTVQGLTTAMSGFGNTALTLVAAALGQPHQESPRNQDASGKRFIRSGRAISAAVLEELCRGPIQR